MKKVIRTEIEINATPEKVWAILTDFQNYPSWNPFITSLIGNVEEGSTIIAHIEPPDANGMTFKLKILVNKLNQELRWIGRLFFKGIFDGEHIFQLIDNKNGSTTFVQSEIFTGILVPLFSKQLDNNTKRGFEAMNEKLKIKAESNLL
jgi:hypothetical protein